MNNLFAFNIPVNFGRSFDILCDGISLEVMEIDNLFRLWYFNFKMRFSWSGLWEDTATSAVLGVSRSSSFIRPMKHNPTCNLITSLYGLNGLLFNIPKIISFIMFLLNLPAEFDEMFTLLIPPRLSRFGCIFIQRSSLNEFMTPLCNVHDLKVRCVQNNS